MLSFRDLTFVKNITRINFGNEGGLMRCTIDNISFPLAIKIHYNLHSLDPERYMNMCAEVKILKAIPYHPNIIYLIHEFLARPTQEMIFACVEDNFIREIMQYNSSSQQNEYKTTLFLIFKAYPSDLKKWMAEKRKDCHMNEIIRICYEISCGVLHLWNHGFVHRSLRLQDILIDDEGHIVITDFGLAVKVNSNGKAFVDFPGGNQDHLAPEVLNCDFRGENVEVDYSKQPSFSLGVLFHEILMGSHPFDYYPFERCGKCPNICVPVWNADAMINCAIDDTIIEMIRSLLCNSPQDRMSLQTCNNILLDKSTS